MYDLDTIRRMNDQAVKKWYETERQKIARLRKELAELESRVEYLQAAEDRGDYEPQDPL